MGTEKIKIVYEYSHLGGSEILHVHYPQIEKEVYDIINKIKAIRTKKSKEKTMIGKMLFSPKDMNQQFKAAFAEYGFSEMRDRYIIEIPHNDIQIKGAYKQIDFVKSKVLVEVQFGKYAFMFYDMAKFQYFFNENKADVGVEIVPCHALQNSQTFGQHFTKDSDSVSPSFRTVFH